MKFPVRQFPILSDTWIFHVWQYQIISDTTIFCVRYFPTMLEILVFLTCRIAEKISKENALFQYRRHRFSDIQMSQIAFLISHMYIKLLIDVSILLNQIDITYNIMIATLQIMKAIFQEFIVFQFFIKKEQSLCFHIDNCTNINISPMTKLHYWHHNWHDVIMVMVQLLKWCHGVNDGNVEEVSLLQEMKKKYFLFK